jgi:hypothetical protein
MRTTRLATAIATLLLAPALAILPASQDLPRNSTGENDVFGNERAQPRTLYEQVADRLKLDSKTQAPAARQLFSDALTEAGPAGQRMLVLRQQMVNLMLANKPDDMKPVTDAYAEAAAQMAGIEARAFAKVYAILKPNQQPSAAQAFVLMAGMFQPPATGASGARGGQRGGGRQ